MSLPLVTVLITTRDRPAELTETLGLLRLQNYPRIELMVIDDHSDVPLEQPVHGVWPEARVIRFNVNAGICQSRSRGMELAMGDYIAVLDDDSCFTQSDDLSRAVARIEAEPAVAILGFQIFNGPCIPVGLGRPKSGCYTPSYVGCGHLVRKSAAKQLNGYRNFFYTYGEEAEFGIRVWDAGYRIYFFPEVLVHHRISARGRNENRILYYRVRNNLATLILLMPARRLFLHLPWRIFSHTVEAVRLGAFAVPLRSGWALMRLMPELIRLRRPIRSETVQTLDGLLIHRPSTEQELKTMPRLSICALATRFLRIWRARPRARNFLDRRTGGVGKGVQGLHPHQFPGEPPASGLTK